MNTDIFYILYLVRFMRVKRRCIFNALRPLKLCHLALENVSLSFFKRFPLNDYAINFLFAALLFSICDVDWYQS